MATGPRIYNLFPPAVGQISRWIAELPRIQAMGFDWIWLNPFHYPGFSGSLYAVKDYHRLNPLLDDGDAPADVQLKRFTDAARAKGIRVMMDLVINHTSKDALLTDEHPEWYARDAKGQLQSPFVTDPDDPTLITEWGDLAEIDYYNAANHPAMIDHWSALIGHYVGLGFTGFRCDAATKVPTDLWSAIIGKVRVVAPEAVFSAETLGCDLNAVRELHKAGFDYLFNSAKWWDFHAPWLLEQYDVLRAIAPSISFPESHDTERLAVEVAGKGDALAWCRLRALFAAFFSSGWMIPVGFEFGWTKRLDVVQTRPWDNGESQFDLSDFIAGVNRIKAETPAMNDEGRQWRLTPSESPVVALLRLTPAEDQAALLVFNTDHRHAHGVDLPRMLSEAGQDPNRFTEVTPGGGGGGDLGPLAVRLYRTSLSSGESAAKDPLDEAGGAGIYILGVAPSVDCGRFPVKREVGDALDVTADILVQGHDRLAARVLWRSSGGGAWRDAPMTLQDNDRWIGTIPLESMGRVSYRVEAWIDVYETWRDEVAKKRDAGQVITVEVAEGVALVTAARSRVQGDDRDRLERVLVELDEMTDDGARVDLLSSTLVRQIMTHWPDRSAAVRTERDLEVIVERVRARFGAWYEIMARSQGKIPNRSATFKDCEARLPEIRAMGFDVVYLLPIHPIGRVHRKGSNNSLSAKENDPGSPYAIGSSEGGHTAIHPELGTLDDFRRLVAETNRLGMEVALDFAIQCAPDHPWVKEHPEWFTWRPDGTIKHAENPPKKYEDIVNVDFQSKVSAALWRELRGVVLFWVGEGVRIFRVDNPHTKAFPFWEWLIRTVQKDHPDVIFLAEAFTRPKLMRVLAKVGFTQSYTYFTWRNFKQELIQYMDELAQGEAREYMRPNFWPNTPDILPVFLQTGGRPAFRIRFALASLLASTYGIYNGYELCENQAVPGKEEYLYSEKYEYKVWDWDRPGNIKDEITRINRIRNENPALHEFENVRFHPADDDRVLFFSKMTLDRSNVIFAAITLDPFDARTATLQFPLEAMGVPPGETFEVEELLTGKRHLWSGASQRLHLDPQVNPVVIYRITVWTSVDYRSPCL